MKDKQVLKNSFIKVAWHKESEQSERLCFFDSDGEYIDYSHELNGKEEEREATEKEILALFDGKDEKETLDALGQLFSSSVRKCVFHADVAAEREKYGDEWVNRIGNSALIIQE